MARLLWSSSDMLSEAFCFVESTRYTTSLQLRGLPSTRLARRHEKVGVGDMRRWRNAVKPPLLDGLVSWPLVSACSLQLLERPTLPLRTCSQTISLPANHTACYCTGLGGLARWLCVRVYDSLQPMFLLGNTISSPLRWPMPNSHMCR